jgi:hypothetical protein
MDVNYGLSVKKYLLEKVTLLHIHRFDPEDRQFDDALVTSAVVWFRNAPPPGRHSVTFSYGGTLLQPHFQRDVSAAELARERKWSRYPLHDEREEHGHALVSDLFNVRRGLATGNNGFFIMDEARAAAHGIPPEFLQPILPSPRYLKADRVNARADGTPDLGDLRQFLLRVSLPEDLLAERAPAVLAYLQSGVEQGVNSAYLCRTRSPWYTVEDRPPAPIVCTYMGRGDVAHRRPFRFILNETNATVTNVYLAMYPTAKMQRLLCEDSGILRRVWQALNELDPAVLLGEGRVYGGGLYKLEPKELAKVPLVGLEGIAGTQDTAMQGVLNF